MKFTASILFVLITSILWADETSIDAIIHAFQSKNLTQVQELLEQYPRSLTDEEQAKFEQLIKQHSPQGNWIPFLMLLAEKSQSNGDFLFFISQALWRSGDVDKAAEMSAKAMLAAPTDVNLLYKCAAIARTLGKLDAAKERIDTVLKLDADNPDALFLRGSILAEEGGNEQAKEILETVIHSHPNHFRSLYELGKLETRLGNDAQAVQYLEQAIEVYPFFREAYSAMRVPLSRLNQPEKFQQVQKQIQYMQNWNPDQYNQLRYWYENALTIGSDERQFLVQELIGVQQYQHAIRYLSQLNRQNKLNGSLRMLLAQLHYNQKEMAMCLSILNDIKDEPISSSEIYLGIKGWALLGIGETAQSKKLYNQYQSQFQTSPNFQALGKALTKLENENPTVENVSSPTRFHFVEKSKETGLSGFQHRMGHADKRWIIDAMGSGVAVADYDNDGDDDIYFVNGRPSLEDIDPKWKNRLFRNDGSTFTDVTDEAGVGDLGWGMCAVFGDVNNDGWLDLFVGNYGNNVFYLNNGDGAFSEQTKAAGLEHDGYAAAAVFGDVDADGDLDLFVGNYVEFDPEKHGEWRDNYHGLEVMKGPLGLAHQDGLLYLNDGTGKFVDNSKQSGIHSSEGRTMGAVLFDMDLDNDLDLYVANDSTYNLMLRNIGGGVFEDISFPSGAAVNESGREGASMGVAAGDVDNDGLIDLYVTAYEQEPDTLYQNKDGKQFQDRSGQANLKNPSYWLTTWGTGFCDFDADGFLDIYTVNGHTYPQVEQLNNERTYPQGVSFYRNTGSNQFETETVKFESIETIAGRGSALLDYDNDGDMDIVINCMDDSPRLLENKTPQGNWLKVKLKGTSAQTYGARVVIKSGDQQWTRFVDGGSSYLSQNSQTLHFGLGSIQHIDSVTVFWQHQPQKAYTNIPINQVVYISD